MAENRFYQQESAETLAIQALAWLLAQDDLVGAFLNATGADTRQMAVLARSGMSPRGQCCAGRSP